MCDAFWTKPQLSMVWPTLASAVSLQGLTNPPVTQVYGTCPDRRLATQRQRAGICIGL